MFDYFSHMIRTKDRDQVKSHHHNILKYHLSLDMYLEYFTEAYSHRMKWFEDNYMTDRIRAIEKCHY